ncbi:MAG: hypothetical protein ACREPA_02210 [Candidatus Dormibacteraceae bacterium]
MVIDAVVILVVLAALLVGFQKGLLQPLLAEVLFFGVLLVLVRDRHAYAAFMQRHLHGGGVVDVFGALILAVVAGYLGGILGRILHRLPVLRGVDGLFGVFVHAGIALAVLYVGISALVSLDMAFGPISNAVSLTARQVAQVQVALATTPVLGASIDPKEYSRLQKEARSGGARLDTASQLHLLDQVYLTVESQLRSSRLARYVMAIGVHFPVVGHLGPGDLRAADRSGPAH